MSCECLYKRIKITCFRILNFVAKPRLFGFSDLFLGKCSYWPYSQLVFCLNTDARVSLLSRSCLLCPYHSTELHPTWYGISLRYNFEVKVSHKVKDNGKTGDMPPIEGSLVFVFCLFVSSKSTCRHSITVPWIHLKTRW